MKTRPPRFARPAMAVAIAAASALAPAVARADAASDAKALFARGRALRAAGHCADAVPVFQQAYATYPAALGSLRNIAECDEALGDREAARRAWIELGHALETHPETKYAGWSEDASQAARRLAPPAEEAKPPASGLGEPQAYAPPAPRVAMQEAPAPDRASDGKAERRTLAWVAVGVGAASLVGAGIGWWVRQSAIDELASDCTPDGNGGYKFCSPAAGAPQERGTTATTVADVLAVVGVAGVAGGLVLLASAPASGPHVAVGMSPGGVWAAGRF